jgi:hypothetical protein
MGKLRVATNSYQNIVLLVLLVIGLLVLYRYIKNVETDTKVLNNNIIELSKKIQTLSKNIQDENTMCMREQFPSEKLKNTETVETIKKQFEPILEKVEDDENESIQSEDITNMLQKVMGGCVSPEFDEIDVIINNIQQQEYVMTNTDIPKSKIEIIEDDEEIIEDDKEQNTVVVDRTENTDDDIIITKPSEKDELLKKTNDELKNILKEKGLQTKGNKTELVDRILSNE